ncbi:hypothetical protein AN189_03000 [Loktanella sp. 3ANDIMAR09]|uniref:Mu transposase C-terminal domain-containing protein n=1 Tax=Loktanella sp. 3ANDIMAR09 TaxID=1225657 RepID=UPI000700A1B3|nr:Mu transposase C-terminal domain-containing protein [Loktanella sp. 3ANDIMAR09]KQI69405.1 hypothetical protein AN189_03000 [Loktanella sp. 3ANDIMAR09]
MDTFMTAQEIADAAKRLGLSCMPHTKQNVNRRARIDGWSDLPRFVRKRSGAAGGGGTEYHVSLLPEAMKAALEAEVSRAVTVESNATRRDVEVAKRQALDTTALTARQRQVMNARSLVLAAIENVQVAEGYTRTQTVRLFVAGEIDLDLDAATIATANDRASKTANVSRPTLLRWFQYRDADGIGALAPKPTKERADVPAWFWDFLGHYARPQKPCITEALDAFLRTPHGTNEPITYSKVRRLIDKLGNVERHRGREGSLTLKSRMAYVTRSTGDLLPTCVYTSDGKTFDAEVAHPLHGRPFRPEITTVVDVATRRAVGFSIGLAENAEGVVDALRHACEEHGVPAIFYVDRGSGFKNKRLDAQMTGLMGRLGITKYHSLPQNSQARGIIERFHGSVWNPLAREFDTYVGVEMDRQARQKSFKVTRKEIREIGASSSLPTWDEFLEGCRKAIATYNAKPHSALPGRQSPDEYWQSHVDTGFEPVIVTKAESDDLFRPYVRRKTRRCLIEYKTNTYFNIALQEYDGDEVLVGYDIHDADRVWVRAIDTADGEDVPGRLICIAKFAGNEERYVPLTMQRLADEGRAKGRLRRAQDKIDEIAEELDPPHLLSGHQAAPFQQVGPRAAHATIHADEAEIASVGEGPEVRALKSANSAPRFGSDAELAHWAIDNPDNLHPSQLGVLRECVADAADRQLLKDHGVDIDALLALLRHAA